MGGLERQPGISLGPQPSRDDPRRLTPSLQHSTQSALVALPFSHRNATATVSHLVAQRTIPSPVNNEFMGMIESITESLHGLLMEDPGLDFGFGSSRGSHHLSRDCFMTGTLDGHVESASKKEVTPAGNLSDRTKGRMVAPSHVGMEQLKSQKREINEAEQQLVREYALVDREIKRHGDGGHARAVAHDVNRRIIVDDETLPHFARASQNITATMALLHGLLEAAMPEDHRDHHEIRTLLERAAAQQAESSLSQRCELDAS